MPTFAYDEAHGERWTIDAARAAELARENPDQAYYGHLADLTLAMFGSTANAITRSWRQETLPACDVLIIAHPREEFTGAEIELFREWISEGGAALILGDEPGRHPSADLNGLLKPFGIQVTDHRLSTRRVTCAPIRPHPILEGVEKVLVWGGSALDTFEAAAVPLLSGPDGQTVVAVAEHGRGRVAVIGDSDLFALPFWGCDDNARLFAGTLSWLAGNGAAVQADAVEQAMAAGSPGITRATSPTRLTEIEGAPVVDVRDVPRLAEALAKLDIDPYAQPEEFLTHAELIYHELPRSVRNAIIDFRRRSNDFGALLIRGLPPDPKTPLTPPSSWRSMEKRTFASELWLAVLGCALGEPISYAQEKDGELFQNMCPTPGNAERLSSESSTILLDLHTETAFHPYLPDYLLLYCIRPDHHKQAATLVSGTRMLLGELPPRSRAALFAADFRTGIDYSFGNSDECKGNGPVLPVLSGDPWDPLMIFDPDLMEGLNEKARTALRDAREAAEKHLKYAYLDEGDLLVVDNRRAVHGRAPFTARYDGMDRWLQRMYVITDLRSAQEDRQQSAREIYTEFVPPGS
ncbi:hypothetical protein FHR32_008649 [Streptosporangium album]|uniref:IFT52 GIFT domain-containing protein n=1 Tax=Streptosporangium album TaxID=47479 RepID=A0A7W7S6P4_9ACTN|nr:DUF4350 domain-containing protein [Streptosporangium album]MBB4944243.1 hypothetical protein [Streptosporangium album]